MKIHRNQITKKLKKQASTLPDTADLTHLLKKLSNKNAYQRYQLCAFNSLLSIHVSRKQQKLALLFEKS